MVRNAFCACLAGIFLLGVAVAAGAAAKVDRIAITYVKLPLNVPAVLAKRLNLFEKEFGRDGIAIQRPELTAGPQQTEAIAAGAVQFASVLGGDSAILAKANGVDLKVIGIFCRAPKAYNVMARNPEIKTVADLKGRTVAGPKGTVLNALLFAALKKEGLKPSDVKYLNMPAVQALAALTSGTVDAALVSGPSLVPAEKAGARVIANGEGLIKGVLVMAVRGRFLTEHPDLVKRYLKVHDESLAYLKAHPAESIKIVAEETQLTEADVKRMLPWYDFSPRITSADIADLDATRRFLEENGMLANTLDIKDLIGQVR